MDIPGTGIHIPLWLFYAATFTGLVLNVVMSNRNSTKTKQLGVTVNDQFSQIAMMVTTFQTSSQDLMKMVLDAKDADFKELQSKYKTLEKDLDGYKSLTETQASDLFKNSSKILSLETLLGDVRKETAERINRLSDQLAASKTLIEDKDKELEKRAQEILALTEKLKKMEALEQDVIQLQADVVRLKADLATMAEERELLVGRIRELEATKSATEQELIRERALRQQAERERDDALQALATEKKKNTDRLNPDAVKEPIIVIPNTKPKTGPLPQTTPLASPAPTITPVVPVDISKPVTGSFATPTTTRNEETQKLPIITPKTGDTPNA